MEVVIVSEANSEFISHEPRKKLRVVRLVVLFFVAVAIGFLVGEVMTSVNEDDSRDNLAQKAEAVLGARLNDSRDGAKVTYMLTAWDGDVLWMDFIMSDKPQEKCSTIVKISEDEQRFGFAPIQEVPFNKQESAEGYCTTVSDEPDGLSIEF